MRPDEQAAFTDFPARQLGEKYGSCEQQGTTPAACHGISREVRLFEFLHSRRSLMVATGQ